MFEAHRVRVFCAGGRRGGGYDSKLVHMMMQKPEVNYVGFRGNLNSLRPMHI